MINAVCWKDRNGQMRDDASADSGVPGDALLYESRLNEDNVFFV